MNARDIMRHGPTLIRTFGIDGLRRRLNYELGRRSGSLARRTPALGWSEVQGYEGALGDLFVPKPAPDEYRSLLEGVGADPDAVIAEAEQLVSAGVRYFSGQLRVPGFPPDWHRHPITGRTFAETEHWTKVPDLSPDLGDIKLIWEPSRFTFAFALVRAYALTGNEGYAEAFWQAFEDWCARNQPNLGPNWRCGQESSLRAFAWLFAWSALHEANATTTHRVRALLKALAFTADRVEATLGYAISQRNGHAVSEAACLWTIGHVLRDHPKAQRWRRLGRYWLERLARTQFSDDGAYIMQSVNYQRHALLLFLWSQRIGVANGSSLSSEALRKIQLGAELLYQMQDPVTGQLPNYGANDGAYIFPLAQAPYEDFRPALHAVLFQAGRKPRYEAGPHDEMVWWFYGDRLVDSDRRPVRRGSLSAAKSGYHVLRGRNSFAFLRAATYTSRPGQADNLHLDIWHRGVNVAFDPGSYSYNSPPPWNNGLVHTRVHNTLTMDARDQMTRGGRFLWFHWLTSEVTQLDSGDEWDYIEVTHSAFQQYDPSVQHRRGILRLGDAYVCLDTVAAEREHNWSLNWNLFRAPAKWDAEAQTAHFSVAGAKYHVQLVASAGAAIIHEAREESTSGWRSTRYLQREAAATLQATARGREAWWFSIFGHETATLTAGRLLIGTSESNWSVTVAQQLGHDLGRLMSPERL